MTDSIDKKSNEKRDNLDVDLDAMLDKAESSLLPMNDFQDDEDAIDRLLMNAGFDSDDELEQSETEKDIDIGLYDELDDFLGFDNFGDELKEPEKTQAAAVGIEDVAGNPSLTPLNQPQNEEDDLDRLLMNAGVDLKDAPMQVEDTAIADKDEELDHFSDFSDFNEPDVEFDEPELTKGTLSALVDDVNESDVIHEDEVGAPAPAMVEIEEPDVEDVADTDDELDHFSDFSDFNEPDVMPEAEVDESEPLVESLSELADADLSEEIDDFSFLEDEFEESDMIQDDEVVASFPVEEESTEELQEAVARPADDENVADSLLLDAGSDQGNTLEQTGEKLDEPVDDAGLSDEIDDFSFLDDEFDESDMIEDEEVGVSVQADTDSIASIQEPQATVEQSSDDEDGAESLLLGVGFDSENALEQTDGQLDEPVGDAGLPDEIDDFSILDDAFDEADMIQDDEIAAQAPVEAESSDQEQQAAVQQVSDDEEGVGLLDEIDDFSVFGDAFDESDMIQDDEVVASVPVEEESTEEQQVATEEPLNDLQDDESGLESLLMDSDFNADDALEQTAGNKDALGDDVDLSEIDEFFQLDEVSDDFSNETGGDQLTETEEPAAQDEDDFLLPDFDITADMEVSDMGINAGTKQDELADTFSDTDFLNEDEAVQTFKPEFAELKLGEDEDLFETQSKQAAGTAIENVENINLDPDPFGLEQEDVEKRLEDAENKVKKAKRFTYIALGIGAFALSAAAGLGVMMYSAKSEVSKLTEQVSALEASLAKNSVNNPNEEINAVMQSVVQLNQQVYGFITELKGNAQFPVDLLNNKVPDLVAKQDMVSKALDMLQVKMGEGKMPLESFVTPKIEIAHEPALDKEKITHEVAPAKTEAAQEHAQSKDGIAHDHASTKEEAASAKERGKHEITPTKVEVAPEAPVIKTKTQPEIVPVVPPKVVVKKEAVKIDRQTVPGKWGVNLVAFKQEWFAKSKAAEFARLGVFAEVIPVYEKGTTMYRLRAGGFKSKAEALSNADRIKRALNLDSVWVSDN
ncbi:MAG: SPOR domain-containing protein [Methylobacter sp.]